MNTTSEPRRPHRVTVHPTRQTAPERENDQPPLLPSEDPEITEIIRDITATTLAAVPAMLATPDATATELRRFAEMAVNLAAPTIRRAEHDRICAILGPYHHVTFEDGHWSMEHSLACRLEPRPLHQCAYHAALEREATFSQNVDGRWRCAEIDEHGVLTLVRDDSVEAP